MRGTTSAVARLVVRDPSGDSSAQRVSVFVVWRDGSAARTLEPGQTVVLGNGPDCDWRIAHESFLEKHASFAVSGEAVEVVDHSDGTRRVVPLEELGRGAEQFEPVRFGGVVASFRLDGPSTLGRSPVTRIDAMLETIAPSDLPILLVGDSGTGKGVLAERIRVASSRANARFVRLSCLGYSDAEFAAAVEKAFGSESEGGPTGADGSDSPGTLFLDEVGELSLQSQAVLLRHLGGGSNPKVDQRLVCSSSKDLETMSLAGRFRPDLFYRIAGHVLHLPPLRERLDDILGFAMTFAFEAAGRSGRPCPGFEREVVVRLLRHRWPGNLRELRHVVEGASMLASDGAVRREHLPAEIRSIQSEPPSRRLTSTTAARTKLRQELSELERDRIVDALDRCAGNQSRAAELLGIGRRTLLKRLDQYSIPRPRRRKAPDEP